MPQIYVEYGNSKSTKINLYQLIRALTSPCLGIMVKLITEVYHYHVVSNLSSKPKALELNIFHFTVFNFLLLVLYLQKFTNHFYPPYCAIRNIIDYCLICEYLIIFDDIFHVKFTRSRRWKWRNEIYHSEDLISK